MAVFVQTHKFLGDFICSEPSLRAISRKHAGDEVVVETCFPEFLECVPYPLTLVPEFKKDVVPDYVLINRKGGNANLVTSVAEENNLVIESPLPDLSIPKEDGPKGDYYLVCSEASTQERHWDRRNWDSLVAQLGAPVLQVGKWAKTPIEKADRKLLGRKLTPKKMAELIRGARAFITVDTGLSHFSAAIQVPYVVLMHQVPVAWREHKGYTRPLQKGDIARITVQDVLEQVCLLESQTSTLKEPRTSGT